MRKIWREPEFSFPKFKSVEGDGFDPVFAIAGALTSIFLFVILLFMLFSGGESVKETRGPRTSRPAPESQDDYLAQALHAENLKSEEILELLDSSYKLPNHDDLNANHADILKKRFELTKILETQQISREQRIETDQAKLETLKAIHFEILSKTSQLEDFDLPPRKELAEELEAYQRNQDSKISGLAKSVLFQSNSLQTIANIVDGDSEKTKELADDVMLQMRDSQDNELALATVHSVVINGIRSFELADAMKLVKELEKQSKNLDQNLPAFRLISEFSDEVVILRADLRQLFDDRWMNGAAGRQALIRECMGLLNTPNAGMRIMGEVDHVAYWFEQEGRHEKAIEIYDRMLQSASILKEELVGEMAKTLAEDGIRRNKLVGQQIDWGVSRISSKAQPTRTLSAKNFEGKIVVVAFWSVFDNHSIAQLKMLHLQARAWRVNGITGLAVHVDKENSRSASVVDIARLLPRFDFISDDLKNRSENSILAQCPGKRVPRFMLIDHKGKVIDINIPIASIDTEVGFLVRQRDRRNRE